MTNLIKFTNIFKQALRPSFQSIARNYSEKPGTLNVDKIKDEEIELEKITTDDLSKYIVNEDDAEDRERYIQEKRNKSRLLPQHLRMLKNQIPYDEAQSYVHNTLKYRRKMYGKFGASSGVDPRYLFQTPEEIDDMAEFERLSYPHPVKEMIEIDKRQKQEQLDAIHKREEQISKKLQKLNQWKTDLKNKMAKKEAEAEALRAKRERAIEEIRRQIGYKLHPRDPRLSEIMQQKEEEDKKAKKLAKKKLKEEKMLKLLQDKTAQMLADAAKQETADEGKKANEDEIKKETKTEKDDSSEK